MTRYPRYKNSGVTWLGDIPEGWEVSKLRAALRERREKYSRNEELMILSLLKDVGVVPYSEKGNVGNRAKEDLSQYKVARTGDFIINSMNVIIGSLGVSQYDGYISPAYYSFEPRKFVSVQYISYLCSLRKVQKAIRCYAKGIMEIRLRVSSYDFLSMSIPLPPLPEQEAIVRYLDETTGKIDKAIVAEERLIELLQERKQIIINEAVGGDLSRAEAQRRRELPKGWKVLPLKRIARLKGGAGFPVQKQGRANEAIHFIKVNALASHIDPTREYDTISSDEAKEMQAKVFPKGSIVFAKVGAALLLHRFEQLPFDSCIDNNMMGLFDITENIKWLRYALSLLDFKTLVNPGAVPSVNQSQVGMMPILLPPLPEQETIVKYLDEETGKIDRAIEVKRRQIALLRERREIIIDEVETGKVKVA